jgi:hypothetical protein
MAVGTFLPPEVRLPHAMIEIARSSLKAASISNEADFSTHTYQQDFHVAPNPKKTITLDMPGKQGRYVKIQFAMIEIARSSLKAAKALLLG